MFVGTKTTLLLASLTLQAQNQTHEAPPLEDQIWEVVASWEAYTACALLAAGIIFAIYGWRISKVLAVINFAAIGGFLGHYLAGLVSIHDLTSTLGLAIILAGLCVWQTRYGVSLLAGGAGGILGAALAYSIGLDKPLIGAGFLLGFVTFALLAFIIYKVAAVLYSSVQGSALVVAGTLSLLSTQESIASRLPEALRNHVYLLPIMLAVPTIASIIIQQRMLKRTAGWSIDA